MGLGQGRNGQNININKSNFAPEDDSIGVIYGSINTTQFKFAITGSGVKRTGYIQAWHERHGWVLGQIMELNLESKLSFAKAQQISKENFEKSLNNDSRLTESQIQGYDASAKGKLAGIVNVIGYKDQHGIVQLPSSPLNAGQRVYFATDDLMKSVLGLDIPKYTGAYIGLLRNHGLRVYLDINSLVQKHVSVIAKTGSGKSYMVGIIVEELLKRKVPTVIIDPHGEYSDLMHPNIDEAETRLMSKYGVKPHGYSDYIHEYSLNSEVNPGSLPLKLPSYGLTADTIGELLGIRSSGVQNAILYKATNRLFSKKDLFTLRELIHIIEYDRNTAKWHLVNSLENLLATGIFSERPLRLTDLVQPGRASVINLRGLPPTEQQIAVTHLTRQLFEARKTNKIPALMLVVEEAHQFCPQQGQARSLNIIKTIASEGRKFGLGLCVVSQRPAMVDKNVLSQCNTQVMLKVTNPNDLKALVASVEGLTTSMIDEIQRLPVSTAIVIGGSIQLPIFVDVRIRETKHGGKPVDVFSNVETFWSTQSQVEGEDTPQEFNMLKTPETSEPTENVVQTKNSDHISIAEQIANIEKAKNIPDYLIDKLDDEFDSQPFQPEEKPKHNTHPNRNDEEDGE